MPFTSSAVKAMTSVALASTLWIPELPEHIALIAISGFFGGVSRWIAARERFWRQGMSSVVLGTIAAVFLWPVGGPWLEPIVGRIDMDPVTSVMFGAYCTGLMGIALLTFIIDFTSARAKRNANAAGSE